MAEEAADTVFRQVAVSALGAACDPVADATSVQRRPGGRFRGLEPEVTSTAAEATGTFAISEAAECTAMRLL